MESGWRPSGRAEADMAEALANGDGRRFAELVLANPLYLPKLPERGTDDWGELLRRLPLEREHVLAFTSTESMSLVLGPYAQGHTRTDFAALARAWRAPEWQLALNPGLPIGVVLPPAALPALARGEETLIPVADVHDAVAGQADSVIRALCLDSFGNPEAEPYQGPPVNDLEVALDDAVAQQDGDAFVDALLGGEVVVPLARASADPVEPDEQSTAWHTVGDDLPVVPVFSSEAALDHVTAERLPRAQVPFLSIVANWPDETHVLCFNPGATTELVLFGDAVLTLLTEVADALEG